MMKSISRRSTLIAFGKIATGAAAWKALNTSGLARSRKVDEFVDYDALGLAQLIQKKEITAKDLTEIVIRRIEAVNPIVNCTHEKRRSNSAPSQTDPEPASTARHDNRR